MSERRFVKIGEERIVLDSLKSWVTYNPFDRSDPELGLLYFNLNNNLCWTPRPHFYLEEHDMPTRRKIKYMKYSENQTCRFCEDDNSIISENTCCSGCSILNYHRERTSEKDRKVCDVPNTP